MMLTNDVNIGFWKTDVNAYTLTSVFQKPMLTNDVNIGFSHKTDVNVNIYGLTSIFLKKTDVVLII